MAPAPATQMAPTVVLGLTSSELNIDLKVRLPVGKDRMPLKQVLSALASVGLSGKGYDKTVESDLNRWEQEVQKREGLYREQHEFYSQVEMHFAEMSETIQRMKRDYYREIDHLREQISKNFRDPDNVIFFDPDLYKLPSWEKIVEMLDGCRMKREVLETEYLEDNQCDRVKQVPINMLCSGCRNKFQTPKEAAVAYREEMRHQEVQVDAGELGWELVRLSARPAPVALAPREEPLLPPAPAQLQPSMPWEPTPVPMATTAPVQEDAGDYGFRIPHRPRLNTGGSGSASFGAASQPDERSARPASNGSSRFAGDGPTSAAPGPASRAATPATASASSAGAAAPRKAGQEPSQDPPERRRGAESSADGASLERGAADGALAEVAAVGRLKSSQKGVRGKHARASKGHAAGDADDAPGSHLGAAGPAAGTQPGAAERKGHHVAGSGGPRAGADGGGSAAEGTAAGVGGGAAAAGGGDAGAEACAGGSSSSSARPKRARGNGGPSGEEASESDEEGEGGEARTKSSKRRFTAEELEERGKAMASTLEAVFSEDPATRALKLLKQRTRTQKEIAASCLVRQVEAMKRHAARMALARWRGATIVCRPVFPHMDDPPAEDPLGRPAQGVSEVNSWGQRSELWGLSTGPVRSNTMDSFQQSQQVMRRSRSLVASQLSRNIPDLQAELAQRPNSSSGVVHPHGAGRLSPAPFFCDLRGGLLGSMGSVGTSVGSRAYLGRPGLLGRGHLPSSRVPWECPTTLQGANPKWAHSYFESPLDQHDQPRAAANPSSGSLNAMDQVKAWHLSTIRLARDKRLPPTGSSSSLMITGERPGTSGGGGSGSMHSASAGSWGLRIHGKQAPKNMPLPPQGCSAAE